ncbi:MAG: GatB/YqeY domain-containing protein [Chloroflexota bacterium]
MTLKETINAAMTDAMKAKDETRKIPLKLVMAAIKEAEIEKREDLEEDEVLRLVQKEVKARQESIADAKKAGREDLIATAKAEMAVLQEYLPEGLSPEELEAILKETINEIGATSMADMGKIMQAVMPKVQGRADGGQVNQLVRKLLG